VIYCNKGEARQGKQLQSYDTLQSDRQGEGEAMAGCFEMTGRMLLYLDYATRKSGGNVQRG
jgi:hypothetical protein